ncbi:sensor histidine kinase [Nocardioides albidus]|uniref:histidine kinase n=1 Tax=Nocardioides albidus TaxID=1517589 RepID=A0A5C4VKS5_9ACTN|nr:sensor histidine kinase [Nocardioides albidus]TNM36412.1 sensor histidine kinase [Nocardioides albidus]
MAHPSVAELTRAHRSWWPWAVLVITALGTGASNAANDVHPITPAVALAVAAVLPAVMPPLSGRAATAALVVSGALCGLYFALGYADGPVFLALPTVTFLTACAVPVPRWLPGALVGVALVAAGLAARWEWHADEPHKSLWQAIGMVGIVLAAGAVATATRNRFEARAERLERTATEERLRMAQDLHDGVGHGLAVIAMQAGVALHVLDRDPAAARSSLEAIRTTSKEALDALRSELAMIAGEPAPRRPAPGLADIPALVDRVRSAGLRVEVVGEPGERSRESGEAAYAVVQESLTNVLRHAGATSARVVWTERGVTVTDDGRGGAVQDEGMGISGMRVRLEALGGTLRVGPHPEGGFAVVAELPR